MITEKLQDDKISICKECDHYLVCRSADKRNECSMFTPQIVYGHWEYGKWERGHWVMGNERCRCSNCHRDFAVDNLNIWNGCPHCRAKMTGVNEDGK